MVHTVVDCVVVVGKLFKDVIDAHGRQPAVHATRTVDEIELVDVAAIDVERLELLEAGSVFLDQRQRSRSRDGVGRRGCVQRLFESQNRT